MLYYYNVTYNSYLKEQYSFKLEITWSMTTWELSCVEIGGNVCIGAHMEFDLIHVQFSHMTDLKWIFSHVKINSYVGNVHILSQTPCVHQCIHSLPFLHRRVLRLLMAPSVHYTAWILGLQFCWIFSATRFSYVLGFVYLITYNLDI